MSERKVVILLGVVLLPTAIAGAVNAEARDLLRNGAIGVWVTTELFVLVVKWGVGFGWWKNFLKIERSGWMLGGTLLCFVFAFGCWIPSGGTDWRVWCNPESALQGHGYWHILAGLGTFAIYMLWCSEKKQ